MGMPKSIKNEIVMRGNNLNGIFFLPRVYGKSFFPHMPEYLPETGEHTGLQAQIKIELRCNNDITGEFGGFDAATIVADIMAVGRRTFVRFYDECSDDRYDADWIYTGPHFNGFEGPILQYIEGIWDRMDAKEGSSKPTHYIDINPVSFGLHAATPIAVVLEHDEATQRSKITSHRYVDENMPLKGTDIEPQENRERGESEITQALKRNGLSAEFLRELADTLDNENTSSMRFK